jgi:hypothetical protein
VLCVSALVHLPLLPPYPPSPPLPSPLSVSIQIVDCCSAWVIWEMFTYIHRPGGPFSTCVGLARLAPITLVPIDCVSLKNLPYLRPSQLKMLVICLLCVIWKLVTSIHWLGGTFPTCVGLARLAPITLVPIDCVSLKNLPNLRPSQTQSFCWSL